MVDGKALTKKLLRFIGQALVMFLITLVLFEASFRLYVIDFYHGDFKYLNADFEKREKDRNLLIVGDSFSAFKAGYAQTLYDSLQEFNVRNISVSGTSIREQYLFGKHHIKKEDPDILVFQFYVGNDLFGWNHPDKTEGISLIRKTYWKLSENLWSLGFLNHWSSQFRGSKSDEEDIQRFLSLKFDPELFSFRDKVYFKAEPHLVENASLLTAGRGQDLQRYMDRMKRLFELAKKDCDIYILIIPHSAQVNQKYLNRTARLGAEFSSDFKPGLASYPLYEGMADFFSNDRRVTVLNPILALKEAEERGKEIYLRNDSHLNREGQQLIGKYLLKEMVK